MGEIERSIDGKRLYPVSSSWPEGRELARLRLRPYEVRAVVTDEKPRPLRPGEWYISGAIPEAYLAPNGTLGAHAVAKLFLVEVERVVVIRLLRPVAAETKPQPAGQTP